MAYQTCRETEKAICVRLSVYTFVYIFVCAYVCVLWVCVCVRILNGRARDRKYQKPRTVDSSTNWTHLHELTQSVCVFIHIYVHACEYIFTYILLFIYVRTYIYIYVHELTQSMHVRVCAYVWQRERARR